jgi:pimeloyl-ACP methyl ester carboxylesterase
MDRRQLLLGAGAMALAVFAGGPALAAFTSDRISVITEGDGPDVILVHGLSSSRTVWQSLVEKLKGRYRFHLVQIGGYAGAPVGANGDGPVAAPVAAEIARYIADAKLDRPAVIGHSMGGTIVMMLAARHPDAVGKVMVVDMMPFMGAMFAQPPATPEKVRPVADQILQGSLAATPAEYAKRQADMIDSMVKTKSALPVLVEHARTSDRKASADAFHELIVTDLGPELSKITAPTTVLYAHTPSYPFSAEVLDGFYKAAYANLKGVKLVRIPEAWHFIMIDQPERFTTEVTTFLAR